MAAFRRSSSVRKEEEEEQDLAGGDDSSKPLLGEQGLAGGENGEAGLDSSNLYRTDRLGEAKVLPGKVVLENIYEQVKQSNENRYNYVSLIFFLLYSILYVVIIMLQRRASDAFLVEESLKGSLFSEQTNTIEMSSGEIVQNMDSFAHIIKWFRVQLVDSVYTDPVCGDGVCESPIEYAQWESYGCADDCGWYPAEQLTQVELVLDIDVASAEEVVAARYNLCSETHGVCFFQTWQTFSNLTERKSHKMKIPDGDWRVVVEATNGGIAGEVTTTGGDRGIKLVSWELCAQNATQKQIEGAAKLVNQCKETTGLDVAPCGGGDMCGNCKGDQACMNLDTCQWVDSAQTCFERKCSGDGFGFGCTFCGDEASCTQAGCDYDQVRGTCIKSDLCYFNCEACNTLNECEALSSLTCEWRPVMNRCREVPSCETTCNWCADEAECRTGRGGACMWDNETLTCQLDDSSSDPGSGGPGRRRMLQTSEPKVSARASRALGHEICQTCWECDQEPDRCTGTPGCSFDFNWFTCSGEADTRKLITDECIFASRLQPTNTYDECTQDLLDNAATQAECHQVCNIPECFYDVGKCSSTQVFYDNPCSDDCYCTMLSDGKCNPACNNEACSYDLGDCCRPVFEGRADFRFAVWSTFTNETVQRLTPDPSIPRKRFVGTQNRLLGGILVNQRRHARAPCVDSSDRYSHISGLCSTGEASSHSFGYDPVFLKNSPLNVMESVYQKKNQYYNLSNPAQVNALGVPYAFHFRSDAGETGGFPVYFDTNLKHSEAVRFLDYIEHGYYLDMDTAAVEIAFVTYNAQVRLFADVRLDLAFEDGGRITLRNSVQTFQTELYESYQSLLRPCLEVIFFAITVANLFSEIREWYVTWKETGLVLAYFHSLWNYIDLANIGLLSYNCVVWLGVYLPSANSFQPKERYEAYIDFTSDARFTDTDSVGLSEMLAFFRESRALSNALSLYMSGSAVSLVLLVLRVLKMLDFQKRMGLVTRTLANASSDLAHFMVLFMIVFIVYSALAHIIFGSSIIGFSTFARALNTNFSILLGEIGVQEELFMHNSTFAAAVYYFSFIFVCCFLLLNVFLAIIVDAYVEVKSSAQESLTLPEELWQTINAYRKTLPGFRLEEPGFISDEEILAAVQEVMNRSQLLEKKSRIGRRLFKAEGFEANKEELAKVLHAQFKRHQESKPELLDLVASIAANDGNSANDAPKKRVTVATKQSLDAISAMKQDASSTGAVDAREGFDMESFTNVLTANIIHRYGHGWEQGFESGNQRGVGSKVTPAEQAPASSAKKYVTD